MAAPVQMSTAGLLARVLHTVSTMTAVSNTDMPTPMDEMATAVVSAVSAYLDRIAKCASRAHVIQIGPLLNGAVALQESFRPRCCCG